MPAKYRVEITRHAEADLEAIYAYIAQDNPAAAFEFVAAIERQISSLERFPLRAPVIPEAGELGVSYRHLIHGVYRTILRVEGRRVYILRVIHGSRLLDLGILLAP